MYKHQCPVCTGAAGGSQDPPGSHTWFEWQFALKQTHSNKVNTEDTPTPPGGGDLFGWREGAGWEQGRGGEGEDGSWHIISWSSDCYLFA